MLQETLISIFRRDLQQLVKELSLYKKESYVWKTDINITNSAGNLTLHLIGNLNNFIGSIIGKTDYKRNRELEFSLKNIPNSILIQQIEDTVLMIEKVVSKINTDDLGKKYPLDAFKKPMTTQYFLIHLTTHLSYHLGQINYHRRILDN